MDVHLDQAATVTESAKMKLRKPQTFTEADFEVNFSGALPVIHLPAG